MRPKKREKKGERSRAIGRHSPAFDVVRSDFYCRILQRRRKTNIGPLIDFRSSFVYGCRTNQSSATALSRLSFSFLLCLFILGRLIFVAFLIKNLEKKSSFTHFNITMHCFRFETIELSRCSSFISLFHYPHALKPSKTQ